MYNYYEEMGLSSDKTDIIKRISTELGIVISKKKTVLSPKQKSMNKSKSSIKKKNTLARNSEEKEIGFEMKQFEVEKMILEPIFRYIPDRAVL
mmetsp:Transcript_29913/g.37067  ORF Transcript_29913/g.37067 Transcript_29913/m.37067 type:complete len:93 (-) Transcript_29913:175-453(-)